MDCKTALQTILDQVDYTSGACRPNEMVGAVLPKEIIALARKAIADEAAEHVRSGESNAPGCTCNAYQLENYGCKCGTKQSN